MEWKIKMTEITRNLLYNKMLSELNGLAQNVVANFQDNMANRENNPFLIFNDTNIKKYMALGRSVDSQLGNRLQRIIFFIARMRYKTEHVPNVVEINITDRAARNIECVLYSISCDLPVEEQNKGFNPYRQYIYVDTHSSERDIKRSLKIKAGSTSLHIERYQFYGIANDAMNNLLNNKVHGKKLPVDLLFFDCADGTLDGANAFEIKMGSNLDTKNSESNAEEVKRLSSLFSFLINCSAYFATCYGECSAAVKSDLEEILGDNTICNNRTFWNKIIPHDKFTYDDFISVYANAFQATGLEESLQNL